MQKLAGYDWSDAALDARVVLHEPETPENELPKPVIRPYPMQYVTEMKSRDGVPLTIRPIRPVGPIDP